MRPLLVFILGALLTLASLTLFGPATYLSVAALYSLALYRLFFTARRQDAFILLASVAVFLELWGSWRFGLAGLVALVIWVLHQLFAVQLRFTSLYVRYIVSLLILFGLYAVVVSPNHLPQRLLALAILSLPIMALSFYFSTSRETPSYELL